MSALSYADRLMSLVLLYLLDNGFLWKCPNSEIVEQRFPLTILLWCMFQISPILKREILLISSATFWSLFIKEAALALILLLIFFICCALSLNYSDLGFSIVSLSDPPINYCSSHHDDYRYTLAEPVHCLLGVSSPKPVMVTIHDCEMSQPQLQNYKSIRIH